MTGAQLLLDWLMHTRWHTSFMWYLVKCFLKVQIDKIYCFIVVHVICVNDLGKEIQQACQEATFVSEAMLRVTYQVVYF